MGPQSGINYQAIKEALMRRAGTPGMGQAPGTPALSQIGQPTGTSPMGGSPGISTPPQAPTNPATPQPQFGSPFAGPKPQGAQGLDPQTKQIAKALMAKLLQVF